MNINLKKVFFLIILFFGYHHFFCFGQEQQNQKLNQEFSKQDSSNSKNKTSQNKVSQNQKPKNHLINFSLGVQYLEEVDHLISSFPHFGINFPTDLKYQLKANQFKHHINFHFNFGNYFSLYQNKQQTEFIQNTGINLQIFFDYQFLITIVQQQNSKILIGASLDNAFTLVTPPYLAYNYSMFHTLGFAMEWHLKSNKNPLIVGGNLSVLGFGFRPSWTGYDFGLEKTLEENGLLSTIGYSYGKYTKFVFWHNYIRFHPFVNYQIYLSELLNLSLKYNFDLTSIFFPQLHFSLRHSLKIGIVFKW